MAKKSNKKTLIYSLIGICIVVIIAIVTVVIIKNSSSTNSDTSEDTSETKSSARVTASELSATPAIEISYGDYDGMRSLSKDIQNGRITGQIVSIDGLVSHPGSNYSVVQENSDGTAKIGTVFNIDDATSYPTDDTRITITAKVVEVSPLNFQLVTLKDFIEEK